MSIHSSSYDNPNGPQNSELKEGRPNRARPGFLYVVVE